MVKTLSSGLEAPSTCLHNGLAEAAPEPAFTVAPNSTVIKPAVNLGWVRYSMIFEHMSPELLATVTGLPTTFIWVDFTWFAALPQLELAMLAILVTLPVILAAESFWALWKSAAVRLLVSFLVLPGARLSKVRIEHVRVDLLELTRPWEDFATVRLVANHLTTVTGNTGN